MSETNFDDIDNFGTPKAIETFINVGLTSIYRPYALRALRAETAAEVDQIGLSLTGERAQTGFVLGTGAPNPTQGKLWAKVLAEVYEYLCTKSSKYKRERVRAEAFFEQTVTVIATAIAGTINIGSALIIGIVTVALLSVSKIGRNAWCKMTAEEMLAN